LAYENLTLRPSSDGEPLVRDLTLSIPAGTRVLVTGLSEAAGVVLFKATSGATTFGTGRITLPRSGDILFLAEKPYLPHGTLRQILAPPSRQHIVTDEQLLAELREAKADHVLTEAKSLD